MKIKTALTVLCAAAALTLASCGGTESSESRTITSASGTTAPQNVTQPTTEATTAAEFHERHDYEDGVLVGRWRGDSAELYFQEDGMISADFDISVLMMFNSDGAFMLSGNEYPRENVQYDGTNLTVLADSTEEDEAAEPVEIISLIRTDEPNPDEIDGRYAFASEELKDNLVAAIVGEEAEDIDITMLIRNGHCIISIRDFCSYTQKGDVLMLSGTLLDFSNVGDCTFVLDGDTCTIYDSNGDTDEFVKYQDELTVAE